MKSVLYTLGVVLQLSGLAAALVPCIALFDPSADLRTMLGMAAFGGCLFFVGWALHRASE